MRCFYSLTAVFVCLSGCGELSENSTGPQTQADRCHALATIKDAYQKGKSVALPRFLREEKFTCATLAEAVNYFVGLGEENTIEFVKALAKLEPDRWANHSDVRMAFVCR